MFKKKKDETAVASRLPEYDVSGRIEAAAFEKVGVDAEQMEAIARPSISF